MQIQVNTDRHIAGSAELARKVEAEIEEGLERFRERITRVEVQLSDESGRGKSVGNDKRCVIEARPAGLSPVTVSDDGASLEQALAGAIDKLQTTLARSISKREDPKGRTSYSGDSTS